MGNRKLRNKEEFEWSEALRHMTYCPEPTYQYNIGDSPVIGNLKNLIITEKHFDGKMYKVEYDLEERDSNYRKTDKMSRVSHYYPWYELRPASTTSESLIKNSDVRLHFMHMMIDSVLHKKYYFGIDMDPDYQRGYVWAQEDKEKLIDSIFNNIDIGKFVFVHRRFTSDGPLYEVLDGKQRINAICEFYENRFPYKGKYFNDLSSRDRWHFCDYGINVAEVEHTDKATILKYFLMLNTGGKIMSEEHLKSVRDLIDKEKHHDQRRYLLDESI